MKRKILSLGLMVASFTGCVDPTYQQSSQEETDYTSPCPQLWFKSDCIDNKTRVNYFTNSCDGSIIVNVQDCDQ